MTKTYSLSAEKRDASKHSARTARNSDRVPAVLYGYGVDPTPLSIGNSDLLKVYRKAGKSSLLDLEVDGKTIKALIYDIQWHPVQTQMRHVDFYAVNLKKETTVDVPLVYEGEAPAVKDLGGIFMKDHETIAIRCLPTEIPHEITVDISGLAELHDHVTVADLNLDEEKYQVMGLEPETVLCSVIGRAAEEEEPEAVEGEEGAEGEAVEGGAEGGEEGGEEKKEE